MLTWVAVIYAYYSSQNSDTWLVFFCVGIIVSLLLCLISGENKTKKTLYIILSFGLINVVTTPILDSPDEYAHFSRSFYIAEGNFGMPTEREKMLVSNDVQKLWEETGETLFSTKLFGVPHEGAKSVCEAIVMTAPYSFITYFPQAVGIFIGVLFHADILMIFFMGRLFNLLAYLLLAYAALKIAKQMSFSLILVFCFPMCIYVAASYNQDAVFIGACMIGMAYFFNLAAQKDAVTKKQQFVFLLFCLVMIMMKLPYALLILLLLFLNQKNYWLSSLFVGLTLGLSFVWLISLNGVPKIAPPGVDSAEQMKYILYHPLQAIGLDLYYLLTFYERYLMMFKLGPLSYGSRGVAYTYFLYFVLVSAVLLPQVENFVKNKRLMFGIVLTTLGIMSAINMSQYLNWTPVGLNKIDGIQGRYFIVLIPFAMLFLGLIFEIVKIKKWIIYSRLMRFMEKYVYFAMAMFVLGMLIKTLVVYY